MGCSRVNGILIPAASLQSCLNRFVSNLAICTDDPDYNIQLPGSTTGIDYRGLKYILCTKHQIVGIAPEKPGILLPDKGSYLSGAGYAHLSSSDPSNNDDNYDLIAYDFTQQADNISGLSGRFFQMSADGALEEKEDIIAYLAYGCPSADQRYDVYDENHIGLVSRSMTCYPIETSPTSPLGECGLISSEEFNMDGLSGGPIFASIKSGSDMVVKLAGIINRAGNGTIHFIKAQFVRNLLDRHLEYRAESAPVKTMRIRDMVRQRDRR